MGGESPRLGLDDASMRDLIVGAPLLGRGTDDTVASLDACITSVHHLLQAVYPTERLDEEAVDADIDHLRALEGATADALDCKRAFLLMALHLEDEVGNYFESDGCDRSSMACDLKVRILPTIVPMYVQNMCQRPDVFVRMATVLHTMWPGEDLDHLPSVLATFAKVGAADAPSTVGSTDKVSSSSLVVRGVLPVVDS